LSRSREKARYRAELRRRALKARAVQRPDLSRVQIEPPAKHSPGTGKNTSCRSCPDTKMMRFSGRRPMSRSANARRKVVTPTPDSPNTMAPTHAALVDARPEEVLERPQLGPAADGALWRAVRIPSRSAKRRRDARERRSAFDAYRRGRKIRGSTCPARNDRSAYGVFGTRRAQILAAPDRHAQMAHVFFLCPGS